MVGEIFLTIHRTEKYAPHLYVLLENFDWKSNLAILTGEGGTKIPKKRSISTR